MTRYELGYSCHYGRYFIKHPEFGLVYPLDKGEYYRDLLEWEYEDEDSEEGILFVSNIYSRCIRYVVISECIAYRATNCETGEIYEADTMKHVYRFAMRNAKDFVRDHTDIHVCLLEVEKVVYSDWEYLNRYGYMQREIVRRENIAYIAVSKAGYTIVNDTGVHEVERR